MSTKKMSYTVGGNNVFADIGIPNAEQHLIKATLVYKIDTIMKKRELKQVDAAKILGIRQPDVSKMLRGEFRQFSVEKLLLFLVALDQDVEIVVSQHRDHRSEPALRVGFGDRKSAKKPRRRTSPPIRTLTRDRTGKRAGYRRPAASTA